MIITGFYISDALIRSDESIYYDADETVPEVPGMEFKLERDRLQYDLSSERLHFLIEET